MVTKTLAFHTSVSYQALAPFPFTLDVHEDILGDLGRYRAETQPSDYDLHVKVSRAVKRLNDGHVSYINYCYDSTFVNYVPLPLALLTDKFGIQNVHIAPEAFTVATAEFPDQIQVWQDSLPGALKGQLASVCDSPTTAMSVADIMNSSLEQRSFSSTARSLGTPLTTTRRSPVATKASVPARTCTCRTISTASSF